MTIRAQHAGDVAFAGAVAAPAASWLTGLETTLTIVVLSVSAIAGIYSILWNRIRLRNEKRKSNEQSKRTSS